MEATPIFQIAFSIIYLLLIIGTILVIISENSNPAKTLAWILVLMFLPAIGLILYYVFGQSNRKKGETDPAYEAFTQKILDDIPDSEYFFIKAHHKDVQKYGSLANLFHNQLDAALLYGSDVEIITEGPRKFEALIEDLQNAKHHIHIEYFYFKRDETGRKIKQILMQKASEGVEVRFIYENIANIAVSPHFYYEMQKSGVEVVRFTKVSLPWIRRQLNFRDHRKIVVIDGKIGYVGGMNIGDEYADKWRDTHLRIKGQGVYGLQSTFLFYFLSSGGKTIDNYYPYFPSCQIYSKNLMQIIPEAPDSEWSLLLRSFAYIADATQDYLYIQTPYYMPSEQIIKALQTAALRGVDVRLMISHKADIFFMDPAIHSYYEESLRAGIRIFEQHDRFIHAKTLVADDYMSVIGSANMDSRSLELSFEINAYLYDEDLALLNKRIFLNEQDLCKEVILEEWLKRPWWKKLIESIMRLFSPLL